MGIIIWLVVGLIAGFLASLIFKKEKKSIVWYLVIGILGSFIGGWLFGLLNIDISGFIGDVISALAGSIVLILIVRFIKKKV